MLFLIANPAAASLKDCKKQLKDADRICQSSYLCMRDYLQVSGLDVIDTGGEVICRGDKTIRKPKNSKKNRRQVKTRKLTF